MKVRCNYGTASPCRYGSKTVLLVCGDKEEAFSKDGHSTYETDSCIVATHMMLEATNIGIDNIWIDMFDRNIIREEFNIPQNLIPVCLLPLGYKSKVCPPSPFHKIRKSIDKIVEYKQKNRNISVPKFFAPFGTIF